MAKEIVVSTLSVLHNVDDKEDASVSLQTKLREQKYTSGEKNGQYVITPVVAVAFMLFVLLYFPCIATILTIRKELGTK
jgi:ferrous iron transport protein B